MGDRAHGDPRGGGRPGRRTDGWANREPEARLPGRDRGRFWAAEKRDNNLSDLSLAVHPGFSMEGRIAADSRAIGWPVRPDLFVYVTHLRVHKTD